MILILGVVMIGILMLVVFYCFMRSKNLRKLNYMEFRKLGILHSLKCTKKLRKGDKKCELLISVRKIFVALENESVVGVIKFSRIVGVKKLSEGLIDGKYGVRIGYVSSGNKKFKKYDIFLEKLDENDVFNLINFLAFKYNSNNNYNINLSKIMKEKIENPSRSIFFIINPNSGYKKSVSNFNSIVEPILKFNSTIKYDFYITKRGGEPKEICSQLNLEKYSEIGIFGGDGTINECVSGIMKHPHPNAKNIPISIFPCGTGNGISCELGSQNTCLLASLICVKGKFTKTDLSSVFYKNKRYFSLLSIGTAAVADVNGECHRFQFFGLIAIRNVVTTIFCLLGSRFYRTKITYISDPEEQDHSDVKYNKTFSEKEYLQFSQKEEKRKQFFQISDENIVTSNLKKKNNEESKSLKYPLINSYFSKEMKKIAPKYIKEENEEFKEPKKLKKTTWENDFFLLSFCNLKKLAYEIWGPGFCRMDNGSMDIFALSCDKKKSENISVVTLFLEFLPLLGKHPNHMFRKEWYFFINNNRRKLRIIRCKAALVEPMGGKFLNIDGEKIEDKEVGKFLFEVHPKVISLMHI